MSGRRDKIEAEMRDALCGQVSASKNAKSAELITFLQEHATYAQVKELYYESRDKKAAYEAYFRTKLKEFGVTSPDNLEGEQKTKFYNEVDAGWKAKQETD